MIILGKYPDLTVTYDHESFGIEDVDNWLDICKDEIQKIKHQQFSSTDTFKDYCNREDIIWIQQDISEDSEK